MTEWKQFLPSLAPLVFPKANKNICAIKKLGCVCYKNNLYSSFTSMLLHESSLVQQLWRIVEKLYKLLAR